MPLESTQVTLTLLWLNLTDWMDLGSELAVATSEPQPAFFVGVPEPPKWNMLCAT